MNQVYLFTGEGHGKSPAAIGEALMRAAMGDQVMIIQFLKGKGLIDSEILTRLEPEVKIFRFEKSLEGFEDLSSERQKEEIINIKNGINFARKVLTTGECDLLVLDEILGIVDNGILSVDELKEMLNQRSENMDVILTGINLNDEIKNIATGISLITNGKESN